MLQHITLLTIIILITDSNSIQDKLKEKMKYPISRIDNVDSLRDSNLIEIPEEVLEYIEKRLIGWELIDESDVIDDWQEFIPRVLDPTKICLDLTGDSFPDFVMILKNEEIARIFIFNNFSKDIKVFELDYYVAMYDKIGIGIYKAPNLNLLSKQYFIINKFESSKARCFWNGKKYMIEFLSD